MPKVSVVMTVYNTEKYVSKAIESVLKQTYKNFELIIVNDCSTDDSAKIIDAYLQKYPDKIKAYHLEQNLGIPKAANFGVSKASGKYIARLDSDDKALPNRLEVQVDYLNRHPNVGMAGSYFYTCNADNIITGKIDNIPLSNKELQEIIPKYNQFGHSTIMMRKNILDQVGGYNESCMTSEDYDLWLRIAEVAEIANLPEFLVIYRIHPEQITQKLKKQNETDSAESKRRAQERRAKK